MKSIKVRDLQKNIRLCLEAAQKEGVVVTRHGKPLALVTGVSGLDWEDLVWATSKKFWKRIQERRAEKTIPIEELRKRVTGR